MVKTFEEFINESIRTGKLLKNLQKLPEIIIGMKDNDEYQWNIQIPGFDFSKSVVNNEWKEFLDTLDDTNSMEINLVNINKRRCYRSDMIDFLTETRSDIEVSKDSNDEIIKLIVPVSEFEDYEFLYDLKYICTQEFTDDSAEAYGDDDEDENVNPLDTLSMYFTDKKVIVPFAKLIDRCMGLWNFETIEDAEAYMGYEDDMKKFVDENPEYKEVFDDALNHLRNGDLNGCIFDYVLAKDVW